MKKWNEPALRDLAVCKTKDRPENKCTSNNGNGENCKYGLTFPTNQPMFKCPYYGKQGHTCRYGGLDGGFDDVDPDFGVGHS